MERLSTLKKSEKENSLKHVNNQLEDQKEVTLIGENKHQPSDESMQFLLSFSKALSTSKTTSLGDVFTVLN